MNRNSYTADSADTANASSNPKTQADRNQRDPEHSTNLAGHGPTPVSPCCPATDFAITRFHSQDDTDPEPVLAALLQDLLAERSVLLPYEKEPAEPSPDHQSSLLCQRDPAGNLLMQAFTSATRFPAEACQAKDCPLFLVLKLAVRDNPFAGLVLNPGSGAFLLDLRTIQNLLDRFEREKAEAWKRQGPDMAEYEGESFCLDTEETIRACRANGGDFAPLFSVMLADIRAENRVLLPVVPEKDLSYVSEMDPANRVAAGTGDGLRLITLKAKEGYWNAAFTSPAMLPPEGFSTISVPMESALLASLRDDGCQGLCLNAGEEQLVLTPDVIHILLNNLQSPS